jgi:hypothetical protein
MLVVVAILYLAWSVGHCNPQVGRVFAADVVALICLVVGAVARYFVQRQA